MSAELAPIDFDRKLALIERGKEALAAARTIPEAQDVRRDAIVIAQLIKQRDTSVAARFEAEGLIFRAEVRIGEMLAEEIARGRPVKGPSAGPFTGPPKLADLGISKNQSSTWQQAALVPEPARAEYVESARTSEEFPTTTGLVQTAKATERYPILGQLPGVPGKEAKVIADSLDALPDDVRAQALTALEAGDLSLLPGLAGLPPMPKHTLSIKEEVERDPMRRWTKGNRAISERLKAIEKYGGMRVMAKRFWPETRREMLADIRQWAALLCNWESDLVAVMGEEGDEINR